jgi:hypothetical protein
MNKKILFSILITILISFTGAFAFAQVPPTSGGDSSIPPTSGGTTSNPPVKMIKLESPIKAKNLKDLLLSLVDLAIFIGSIVAVFTFIWVGFKLVMAQGNPGEIEKAKEWFTAAIIGTAILISSKVIVEVVRNTLTSSGLVNEQLLK